MDKSVNVCSECGSEFYKNVSKMDSLCPECAHLIYGYPNCNHKFENGRCVYCYWNGKHTKFTKTLL